MDEYSMVEGVADSFREYGFLAEVRTELTNADGKLTLRKDGVEQDFQLEVKLPLTINTLSHYWNPELIYVTDHVSARTAEVLRRMGVGFIDAAGNAFLQRGGWYVDVRGRQRRHGSPDLRLEGPSNLYSAKRSQVIFALLTWPELLDASIRTIAEVAGVSVGIAQSTTNELRRRELWPDRLDARSSLIDGWAAAFPGTLARSLTIRALHTERFDSFDGPVLASGEAAPSAHMRATSGVVYVEELTRELLIANQWRTDRAPNLTIRRVFWSHPDLSRREAPPLLVYGDLQASDDPRVRFVAGENRESI